MPQAERVTAFQLEPVTELTPLEPMLDRYVRMVVERMAADNGVDFGDPEEAVRHHNALFRNESPSFLTPPGMLLAAHISGKPVGVGGLKAADARRGEIKRMYVEPVARGLGIGRAILQRLLDAARSEKFDVVRLETATFMTEALTIYRSVGFTEVEPFAGSETATTGMKGIVFLELNLRT
ncbi:GNAT family N-acetyltransferase [Phytohabitans aurantiacus]|uniref:N-acetyltransferase domain-containing protein n=1 Tax=Phytohabitans aurantiacus TaxID=3016789 RepID=A0ABQ5R1I8_9ACTN|nr:GNAT family N-acetyltransferase [Phytohabitans aurantiacus]GLI00265.1 hypothetical protein Pa4123_55410 [Phytohabitans aurantiacus]